MREAPKSRSPKKVVVMVVVYWVGGNVLQSVIGSLFASGGLLEPDTAFGVGLVLGWGLLFLISYYFREPLDDWLRS